MGKGNPPSGIKQLQEHNRNPNCKKIHHKIIWKSLEKNLRLVGILRIRRNVLEDMTLMSWYIQALFLQLSNVSWSYCTSAKSISNKRQAINKETQTEARTKPQTHRTLKRGPKTQSTKRRCTETVTISETKLVDRSPKC